MHWTANRIANFQAAALGLSEEGKTRLHRVLRNIVMKDVVDSEVDELDSRGTRLLSEEAAAIALLLVPLADLAMDVRGLRDVANALKQPSLNRTRSRIADILAAVREGRQVKLHVKLNWEAETGKIKRTAFASVEDEETPEAVTEIKAAYKALFPRELASAEVNASDVLREFVA